MLNLSKVNKKKKQQQQHLPSSPSGGRMFFSGCKSFIPLRTNACDSIFKLNFADLPREANNTQTYTLTAHKV